MKVAEIHTIISQMKTKTIVISTMITRVLAMMTRKMLLKTHILPDNPQIIFKIRGITTRIHTTLEETRGIQILGILGMLLVTRTTLTLTSSKIITISTVSTPLRSRYVSIHFCIFLTKKFETFQTISASEGSKFENLRVLRIWEFRKSENLKI